MGLVYNDILGERQQFYVITETTPGTFKRPAATSAMAVLTTDFSPMIARKNRRDSYQASRDTLERITGKSEYSWSVDAYYVPSGSKATAPNCGPMLKSLFGTETVGSNDVTYSQSSSQTLSTFSCCRQFQSLWMETLWGCITESMTFKCSGGDEPKVHFEGRACGYVATGASTLKSAMGGANAMTVQDADNNKFGINSVIKIDSDDGLDDLGYKISAGTTSPYTLVDASDDSSMTSNALTGAVIAPHTPTWTDAGVPTTGITGSCTWDSLDISAMVTGFEVTVKANNIYHDNAAFQQNLSDATPGFFDITGKIDLRMRSDALVKIFDRKAFATKALSVIVGGAAQSGTRGAWTLGYCEMDFTNVTIPEAGIATISVPFTALGSSGNDACSFMHT